MKAKKTELKMGRVVELPLSALQESPYNPRTISREKMAALKASLVEHGMVLTLVIQVKSKAHGKNVIIGGHQRVRAMRELCKEHGWPEPETVPCVLLDVEDAQARRLNVTLNNVEGEFDPYKLGEIFASMLPDMTQEQVLATGFASEELAELVKLVLPPDEQAALLEASAGGDITGFAKSVTLSVEFSSTDKRDAAKDLLRKLAGDANQKAGDLMFDAVKGYAAIPRKVRTK